MLSPEDFNNLESWYEHADEFFQVFPETDLIWIDSVLFELMEDGIISTLECERLQMSLISRGE